MLETHRAPKATLVRNKHVILNNTGIAGHDAYDGEYGNYHKRNFRQFTKVSIPASKNEQKQPEDCVETLQEENHRNERESNKGDHPLPSALPKEQ